MKLISWNVNGLRACLTHDFAASFAALDADIFSVQETKMQPGQADFAPEGYTEYTYSAEKKGYSGTACWCRQPPLAVTTGIGIEEHDHEGRVLTLEYPAFYLVNCYTPNSQDGLKRLDYRMTWEDAFRAYLLALDAKKPVILCGDLNAIPSSNVIATMTAFLTNVGTIDQYTFPSENPTRKIDYILYAPIGHFGVQNCQVVSRGDQQVGGVDASDHRPVIADIRFQTEEDISGEDGGGEE